MYVGLRENYGSEYSSEYSIQGVFASLTGKTSLEVAPTTLAQIRQTTKNTSFRNVHPQLKTATFVSRDREL